jgi:hypothetical protein
MPDVRMEAANPELLGNSIQVMPLPAAGPRFCVT